MNKQPLVILGFGGNAIDFFDTISCNFDIIGFVDDDEKKKQLNYKGIKVFGRDFLEANESARVISMIGSEKTYKTRHELINSFNIKPERFVKAIHPSAQISKDASIGYDVTIMPGVVITSNAKIGNHVFILANTVIHHDVVIGNNTLIGSNVTLAGHVQVGKNCFLGSASSFKNNVTIGDNVLVGMSSNVVKNISSGARVAGNPAIEIK